MDAMHKAGLPDDLHHAKREARRRYLRSPSGAAGNDTYAHTQFHSHNVTAVGIGRKVTGGVVTDGLAVRLYVRSKLPKGVLGKRAFPSHFDGVATDVIVCGLWVANS